MNQYLFGKCVDMRARGVFFSFFGWVFGSVDVTNGA